MCGFDTNYKMNPPLRTRADIDALIGGIADGTVTILCSDHAPHATVEKEVEFDRAPFGILGLETEFGLFHHLLVEQQKAIGLPRLIELLTDQPRPPAQAGPRHAVGRRGGGRDAHRPRPGMDGRAGPVRLAFAQHALRRLAAQGPRGADDRRRQNGVDVRRIVGPGPDIPRFNRRTSASSADKFRVLRELD